MPEPVSKSKLLNMLQGLQQYDPRLYDLLREIIRSLDAVMLDVSLQALLDSEPVVTDVLPEIENLQVTIRKRYIEVSWNPVVGLVFVVKQGEEEATADIKFVTTNNIVYLDADEFLRGAYSFHVGFIGRGDFVTITLATVGVVGLIDVTDIQEFKNTLILTWETPTSDFTIDYYDIRAGQMQLAKTSSNVFLHLANTPLEGMVSIRAVDIAGNIGPDTFFNVSLSEPSNFFRIAGLVDVIFDGAKTNGWVEGDLGLLMPVDITEEFETNRIPQETVDSVALTYPFWVQPSAAADGQYIKEFDFEAVRTDVYLSVIIACLDIDEDHRHMSTRVIEYKTIATDAWVTLVENEGLFVTSVRFVRITFNALAADDLRAICLLKSIQVILSLAFIEDSGESVVVSGAGQDVVFSVGFTVPPHVVSTVKTTNNYFSTVHAISITQFTVRVVDVNGAVVDGQTIEWQARGGI